MMTKPRRGLLVIIYYGFDIGIQCVEARNVQAIWHFLLQKEGKNNNFIYVLHGLCTLFKFFFSYANHWYINYNFQREMNMQSSKCVQINMQDKPLQWHLTRCQSLCIMFCLTLPILHLPTKFFCNNLWWSNSSCSKVQIR